MIIKTCCCTGHRDIPADRLEYVERELRREILQAIADGYTQFISGFARGSDLLFASIVAELKAEHPSLVLEAAIPYRNRVKTPDKLFHRLLNECGMVGVYSEEYSPSCYLKRNRMMILLSERVIAVYDGRGKGGTASTLRYAYSQERDVRIIPL